MIHEQSEEQRLSNLERTADYIYASYFLFKNKIAHTTNYTTLLNFVSRLDGSRQIQTFMDLSPLNELMHLLTQQQNFCSVFPLG